MNKQPELPDLMRDLEIKQALKRMGRAANDRVAADVERGSVPDIGKPSHP